MANASNRRKIIKMILFTALFLLIFRFGAYIPLPFINKDFIFPQGLELLNLFSGGALSQFSILALGVSPYITASIVVQLLQMDIIPVLKEWSEEGPVGKQKINQLTRYLALGLAFVQSLTITIGLGAGESSNLLEAGSSESPFTFVYLALVATAGTAFSLWIAERITAKGIGNGTSMLIVTGILATFPSMINELVKQFLTTGVFGDVIKFIVIILLLILIIVGVVFMEAAQRKIPIQYANRPAAATLRGKSASNVPIKLNSASVIPVIFAATLMSLPTTVVSVTKSEATGWGSIINLIFSQTEVIGFALYIILIFVFSFFYAFLQLNPESVAQNLQKNNAYIPGVRPGEETASYISRVLFKLTMVGATYLAIIASLPIIIMKIFNLSSSVQIGGTGLIIVVGVALETAKQIRNISQEKQYRGFIK